MKPMIVGLLAVLIVVAMLLGISRLDESAGLETANIDGQSYTITYSVRSDTYMKLKGGSFDEGSTDLLCDEIIRLAEGQTTTSVSVQGSIYQWGNNGQSTLGLYEYYSDDLMLYELELFGPAAWSVPHEVSWSSYDGGNDYSESSTPTSTVYSMAFQYHHGAWEEAGGLSDRWLAINSWALLPEITPEITLTGNCIVKASLYDVHTTNVAGDDSTQLNLLATDEAKIEVSTSDQNPPTATIEMVSSTAVVNSPVTFRVQTGVASSTSGWTFTVGDAHVGVQSWTLSDNADTTKDWTPLADGRTFAKVMDGSTEVQSLEVNVEPAGAHTATLTDGSVSPTTGIAGSTTFVYTVTYTDSLGHTPTARVVIDGVIHMMAASGTQYTYTTTLPNIGDHDYYFEFTCTGGTVRSPGNGVSPDHFDGPFVSVALPQHTMSLSSPHISASSGTTSVTSFTYTVIYTDSHNHAPLKHDVNINGTNYPMSTSDNDFSDGSTYSYSTVLPTNGLHTYFFDFACNQSVQTTQSVSGPITLPSGAAHVMSIALSSVSPTSGITGETAFEFKITYTDNLNLAPETAEIMIDGATYEMTTTDTTYIDGSIYTYTKTFTGDGDHQYKFKFKSTDITKVDPSSGTNSVNTEKESSHQQTVPPQQSNAMEQYGWIIGVGLAGIGILIAAIPTLPTRIRTVGKVLILGGIVVLFVWIFVAFNLISVG